MYKASASLYPLHAVENSGQKVEKLLWYLWKSDAKIKGMLKKLPEKGDLILSWIWTTSISLVNEYLLLLDCIDWGLMILISDIDKKVSELSCPVYSLLNWNVLEHFLVIENKVKSLTSSKLMKLIEKLTNCWFFMIQTKKPDKEFRNFTFHNVTLKWMFWLIHC